MADPFSITAVFAFMNSALKFSEVAVKFYSVESENGVFVRMIQTVRQDLDETERLLCVPAVREQLISTPGKLPWIKSVIISTKSSINEIGRWVERVRGDKEGYGSVSWENRIRWVFSDNDKLVNRRMELGSCHQALSTVLIYLTPLERGAPAQTDPPPEYDDATFLDQYIISPFQRRRNARSLQNSAMQPNKETEVATANQVRTTKENPSKAFTMTTAGDAKDTANFGFLSNPNPLPQSLTCFSFTTSSTENSSILPTFQDSLDSKPKFDTSTCPITPPAQHEDHLYSLGSEECSTTTYTKTPMSNYSPPWFHDQAQPSSTSQHMSSEPSLGLSKESFIPRKRLHTSSLPALPPKIPLDTQKHRFSATSFGPVDPYSFTLELDATPGTRCEDTAQKSVTTNTFPELNGSSLSPSLDTKPSDTRGKLLSTWSVTNIPELPENTIPFRPNSVQSTSHNPPAQISPPSLSKYPYSALPEVNGIRHYASAYTFNSLDSFELPSNSISPRPTSSEIPSQETPIASPDRSTPSRKSSYQPYRGPISNDDRSAAQAQSQSQSQSTPYQYRSPNQYPSRSLAKSITPMSSVSTLLTYTSLADPEQDKYPIPVPDSVSPSFPLSSEAKSISAAPAQAASRRYSQPPPYPYETSDSTSQSQFQSQSRYQIPDYRLHQQHQQQHRTSAPTLSPMSSTGTLTSSPSYPMTPDDYAIIRPVIGAVDSPRPTTAAASVASTLMGDNGQYVQDGSRVQGSEEASSGRLTMGESRRRNQRAMLEILARGDDCGGYGDGSGE